MNHASEQWPQRCHHGYQDIHYALRAAWIRDMIAQQSIGQVPAQRRCRRKSSTKHETHCCCMM
eukprot:6120498-Prorocentrum_lima.AAC.1